MPPVPKIDRLPDDERELVRQVAHEYRFADLDSQKEEIEEAGIEGISRAALGRYNAKLKALQGAVSFAKELQEAVPDDSNALTEATTRIAQEKFLSFISDLNDDDLDLEAHYRLSRTANAYATASIRQKKYYQELKGKLEAKFAELGSSTAAKALDPETLRIVREEIYGIL